MPRRRCSNLSDLSNMHLVCTSWAPRDRGLCSRIEKGSESDYLCYQNVRYLIFQEYWAFCQIKAAHVDDLLAVDVKGWLAEVPSIKEHSAIFGSHLPEGLNVEVKALEERLQAAKP